MTWRAWRAAALPLALAGCSLAPRYVRPEPPVPASWPVGDAYLLQQEAALPAVPWREVLRDPRLQALVEQALANNRDLRIAAANIAAARARARQARAGELPEVVAGGSASLNRDAGGSSDRNALSVGIPGFELDLFGRLANATAAERERALSTESAARTVRLALIADLADAWATYAADRELLAIARDTAASAGRSVGLTRARLEGGIAPRTDLRQAEQVQFTAEADVAAGAAALAQDENVIRLLVGAAFDRALLPAGLPEADAAVAAVPAGTSSEVLLRRPDVVEAEYLLRAANADIGVARAELFPRLSLSALLGLASGSLGFTVGADSSYRVFDAGAGRAGVAVSRAQRDAALAAYERAIQTAFREVADALADAGTLGERLRAAADLTAAAADLARLSEARYRGGIESFLNSLDAQRSLYAAQRAESAVRLAAIRNRIALWRSLGGDETTPTGPGA